MFIVPWLAAAHAAQLPLQKPARLRKAALWCLPKGARSAAFDIQVLDDFEDICKDNNMVIISIPTLLDPGLAPEGHHVLHAYYAADEPYAPWAGLDRRSDEYAALNPGPSPQS